MHRFALSLALVFLFSCKTPAPEAPASSTETSDSGPAWQAPKQTPHDATAFFQTETVFATSFSHDESELLIGSDRSGIFNAYSLRLNGGDTAALTESRDDGIFPIRYFPGDSRFLYRKNSGGNELDHIFVVEPGKEPRDLTPGDRTKALFFGFRRDGGSFFIATNERDPRAFDLYRYDATSYERSLVFENRDLWSLGEVSPNGKLLALSKRLTNAHSDVYVVELREKRRQAKPKNISSDRPIADRSPYTFTPDSQKLLFGSDEGDEFRQVWSYDVKTGAVALERTSDWDVSSVDFSENGRYRVTRLNRDAATVLEVVETATGNAVEMPELPPGDIKRIVFSPSETKLALHLSGDRSPTNLHVVDLEAGSARQLTDTLNPAIKPSELVEGVVVRYKSFDGVEVPAILYRPHQSKKQPAPALVWVHGGPGGQSRLGYSPMIQHLVHHGYAVLAVNNRGSSGYGKTFYHLDDKNHGDGDLNDCVEGARYLQGLDWVDRDRIGIIGGSYGGYMVLAALAFRSGVFKVGVDIFGVANWIRTLESIPPWWASFRNALYTELGDPNDNAERARLESVSPLLHADQIVTPLLVVQGANDPRVLKVESDEIVAAVRKNGVPVEYVVFDDEGHGFLKRENRIKASDAYVQFLKKHL